MTPGNFWFQGCGFGVCLASVLLLASPPGATPPPCAGPAGHMALFSKPFEDRTPASAAAESLCPCAVGCTPSQKRYLSGWAQVEMIQCPWGLTSVPVGDSVPGNGV